MVQASAISLPAPASAIPLREILPWAIFAFAIAFVAMYLVGFEEGAWTVVNSNVVHEFVHDARHLAGLPCH
ncbi:MAG: CbtB-domain containing protein [Dehalococcoidia bacterium]|nr:CbtB-domain containing protein [Dehalococcoidia bacterium]